MGWLVDIYSTLKNWRHIPALLRLAEEYRKIQVEALREHLATKNERLQLKEDQLTLSQAKIAKLADQIEQMKNREQSQLEGQLEAVSQVVVATFNLAWNAGRMDLAVRILNHMNEIAQQRPEPMAFAVHLPNHILRLSVNEIEEVAEQTLKQIPDEKSEARRKLEAWKEWAESIDKRLSERSP